MPVRITTYLRVMPENSDAVRDATSHEVALSFAFASKEGWKLQQDTRATLYYSSDTLGTTVP
jgi:hypothetical protein